VSARVPRKEHTHGYRAITEDFCVGRERIGEQDIGEAEVGVEAADDSSAEGAEKAVPAALVATSGPKEDEDDAEGEEERDTLVLGY